MIRSYGLVRVKSTVPIYENTLVPISNYYHLVTGAYQGSFGGGSIVTRQKQSAITYTCTSPTNRQQANMCRHIVTETKYMADATSRATQNDTTANRRYEIGIHHTESSITHSQAVVAAKAAFGIQLKEAYLGANGQGLINQAAWELRPDLTTVSVPNFLIEIKDIVKLFNLWKTSLSVAKNLAGAHLNYKFGWKPTIGDLSAVVTAISSLKDRIAAFEKSLNLLFHRSTTLLDETTIKSGSILTPFRKCSWKGTVKRTCTAHVVWRPQPLKAISDLRKNLLGLLDSLGFELNPQILWDALPFTFVIDWFFDVGGFLQRYSVDTLELPIVYVDSYLQYKEELVIESDLIVSYNSVDQNPVRSGGWVTSEKFFQRMPLFPDYSTLTAIGWKHPTTSQAMLGLSLAVVLGKKT